MLLTKAMYLQATQKCVVQEYTLVPIKLPVALLAVPPNKNEGILESFFFSLI